MNMQLDKKILKILIFLKNIRTKIIKKKTNQILSKVTEFSKHYFNVSKGNHKFKERIEMLKDSKDIYLGSLSLEEFNVEKKLFCCTWLEKVYQGRRTYKDFIGSCILFEERGVEDIKMIYDRFL